MTQTHSRTLSCHLSPLLHLHHGNHGARPALHQNYHLPRDSNQERSVIPATLSDGTHRRHPKPRPRKQSQARVFCSRVSAPEINTIRRTQLPCSLVLALYCVFVRLTKAPSTQPIPKNEADANPAPAHIYAQRIFLPSMPHRPGTYGTPGRDAREPGYCGNINTATCDYELIEAGVGPPVA